MAEEGLVLVERDGRVGVVLMNRPKALNALSSELMDAVVAALEQLDDDPEIRAIVLGGGERAFAAGADIGELAAATPVDALREPPARAVGPDPRGAHADRRRGVGLLPRRRLRARDALRPDRRLGDRALRAAGDQPRHPPRRGRDAAADARRRQGGGDGHDPHGPDDLRARGARLRARRPRRPEGAVARRGEAGRRRDRGEGPGLRPAREGGGRRGASRRRSPPASSSSAARSTSPGPPRTRRRA